MKVPRRDKRALKFNITPLIDITFLLIVFFVMSNRLIREEVAMEMDLPRETTGETLEQDESGKLVVNVTRSGDYYFGAKRVDPAELRARLTRERERSPRPIAVRIRADRDAPYGVIEPLLVACAQAGLSDVSFAVVEE